jgi:LPXTG-motif cell wall-anchored protein
MKSTRYTSASIIRKITYTAFFVLMSAGVWAQDASTVTVRHHTPSYKTVVRNARVVYVEGNDLVLKLADGKVEHLVVPDSDRFLIDGKNVTVRDLKPGTTLTQSITTTTTPRTVNTVRTLKGKVWHVNAPSSVIVSLPDGTNHLYKVPSHAKFVVNSQPKTVWELKKGMSFEATIITDEPQTLVAESKTAVGRTLAPETSTLVGVLLIQPTLRSSTPAPEPVMVASNEPLPATLPKTGSELPLIGLLGGLATAASLVLGSIRRRRTI